MITLLSFVCSLLYIFTARCSRAITYLRGEGIISLFEMELQVYRNAIVKQFPQANYRPWTSWSVRTAFLLQNKWIYNVIWYVEITYNSGYLHWLNNFPNSRIRAGQSRDFGIGKKAGIAVPTIPSLQQIRVMWFDLYGEKIKRQHDRMEPESSFCKMFALFCSV